MTFVCPILRDVNFGHLVGMEATRFLHCEIISPLELVSNLSGELTNLLNENKVGFLENSLYSPYFPHLLLPGEKIISEP